MDQFTHVENVVRRILNANVDITSNYDDWMRVAFSLANLGEQGRDLFLRASSLYPGYNREECSKKFDNVLKGRNGLISLGTFFDIAKRHNIDISKPKGRPRQSAEEKENKTNLAIDRLNEFADYRYNEISNRLEIFAKFPFYLESNASVYSDWKVLDDIDIDTIYVQLRLDNIKISKNDVVSIINSRNFHQQYNPIKDYLDSLPVWIPEEHEGETPIVDFFSFLEFPKDKKEFALKYCQKWFLNLVALLCGKIESNELMLTFLGEMNVGKSFFCRHILPPDLKRYIHTIYPNTVFDKDEKINMSSFALLIFDEFEVSKKNINTIKAVISSTFTYIREAYGRLPKYRKRVCSFVANANNNLYLPEEEGNRRFVSVNVLSTKHIGENSLPYEAAYAQALYLINQPEYRSNLSPEEVREISENNKGYTVPDLCEELIQKYYRKPEPNEIGIKVSVADVIERISVKVRSHEINTASVGKALTRLGFEKSRAQNRSRYYVSVIDDVDNDTDSAKEGETFYNEGIEQEVAKDNNSPTATDEDFDIFHSSAIDDLYNDRDDDDEED